jgi:hypothetical protein
MALALTLALYAVAGVELHFLIYNKEVKMIPKIKIGEVKKKRIIEKAGRLGAGEAKNYGA